MNLFDLSAKLTLDKSDYDKKIDQAKEQTKDFGKNTKDSTSKSAIAWGAVATAVVAVLTKVKDLIIETANYADQIGDLAQNWGFTTREIQEFDYWATMSGTNLQSLLTGMRGLVNQAEAGSSAFEKLGVNVRNSNGTFKDQKTLFLETIDALKQIDNQTERNALQFEIFGRAGIELGQIINRDSEELHKLSKEAESLGIILDQNTIEQAGNFNDSLDQLRLSFKSVMAEIIAGSPEADAKFEAFLNNLEEKIEEWTPKFINIVLRLASKIIPAISEYLITSLPRMLIDAIFNIDWIEVGKTVVSSFIKGIVLGFVNSPIANILTKIFGIDIKKVNDSITGGIDNVFGVTSKEYMSLNNTITNSNGINTDNSTTNVTVNMTSTGYTSEDARNLANEVIKEIATKKQASGR